MRRPPRKCSRHIPGGTGGYQFIPVGNIRPNRYSDPLHLGTNRPHLPEQRPVVGQPPEIFPQACGCGNAACPPGRYRCRIPLRYPVKCDPQTVRTITGAICATIGGANRNKPRTQAYCNAAETANRHPIEWASIYILEQRCIRFSNSCCTCRFHCSIVDRAKSDILPP